jgi:hypothetical protein
MRRTLVDGAQTAVRATSDLIGVDTGPMPGTPVGSIERGESNVTLQTLKILADTLDVQIGGPGL